MSNEGSESPISAANERLKDYRDIATIILPGKGWKNDEPVYRSAITHAGYIKNRMVIADPRW